MPYDIVFCAACNEPTTRGATCDHCHADPRLNARYWLLDILGEGSFGMTWRAERITDGAVFAAKELLIRRLSDFKTHDLFQREVNALKDLRHPGIPTYIDDFTAGSGRQTGLYLIVELIDGETLASELTHRHYDFREALGIIREIATILAYLHDRTPPVVHRDLKPSNIMRRQDGRLCLIDFGTIKDVLRQGEGGSTVAGTFGYMPPEQLTGRAVPASDLYALGVILLELVTRRPPQELYDDHNQLAWRPALRGLPTDTLAPLTALFDRLLAPNPAQRPPHAHDLMTLLDRMLSGRWQPTSAEPSAASPTGASFINRQSQQSSQVFTSSSQFSSPNQFANVAALLQGLGMPNLLAAPQLAASSTPVAPPPPAPRSLPRGFAKRAAPGAASTRLFAGIWSVLSLMIGGTIAAITLKVSSTVSQLGGPAADLTNAVVSPGLLLPLLFPLIGIILFLIGHFGVARAKRTFRNGKVAPATVIGFNSDYSMRMNGRPRMVLTFQFVDEAGEVHVAERKGFNLSAPTTSEAYAIYDPKSPEKALLWPF